MERVLRTQGWEVGKVAGGYCFYAGYQLLTGAGYEHYSEDGGDERGFGYSQRTQT